jgi:hypothetical protein
MSILEVGQELAIRRHTTGQVLHNLTAMRLAGPGGNINASVHVTFVDATGVSLYVARTAQFGGDMRAYLRKSEVMWQAYFEPLRARNMSYRESKHYTDKFPLSFLARI